MSAGHEPSCCPVCDGTFVVQRHQWLRSCVECGCLASTLDVRINADNAPLDEELRADALRALRKETFAIVLDALAFVGFPKSASILDVGCAHGWFLQQATACGYRSVGIEPDQAMATLARAQGAEARIGMFPQALLAGETFDAITFNDVLEHLPDVSGATAAVRAHLTPGGLFVVNIPLATGFFYRLANALDHIGYRAPFERMWQVGFASPHRSYFTEQQLIRLAERHGFKLAMRRALPSLRISGLWQRLRYDRSRGIIWALLMWPALVAMSPIIRLWPHDIGLLIFKAGDPTP
jgi:2-polyprenyl-3-methyl-5-hydroxy-6-metoxy-1,4-benzoquinol methylase